MAHEVAAKKIEIKLTDENLLPEKINNTTRSIGFADVIDMENPDLDILVTAETGEKYLQGVWKLDRFNKIVRDTAYDYHHITEIKRVYNKAQETWSKVCTVISTRMIDISGFIEGSPPKVIIKAWPNAINDALGEQEETVDIVTFLGLDHKAVISICAPFNLLIEKNKRDGFMNMLVATYQKRIKKLPVQESVTHLGWGSHKSFVLGEKKYQNGISSKIFADGNLKHFAKFVVPTGTTKEWCRRCKNLIPDTDEYLPHKLMITASFAGPIYSMGNGSTVGSLLHAYSPVSGAGKTESQRIGSSIWGHTGWAMVMSDSSLVATCKKIATTHSIPLILDELTSYSPKQLVNLLYSLSNGREKERSDSAGKELILPKTWRSFQMSTGNKSIFMALTDGVANRDIKQDIMGPANRLWEVYFPNPIKRSIPEGYSSVAEYMDSESGCVGDAWAQYLSSNIAFVTKRFTENRKFLESVCGLSSPDRYPLHIGASIITAAEFAFLLNLSPYKPISIRDFVVDQLKNRKDDMSVEIENMRRKEMASNILGEYLDTNFGRMYKFDPPDIGGMPMEAVPEMRAGLAGRIDMRLNCIYISIAQLHIFCTKTNRNPNEVYHAFTAELYAKRTIFNYLDGTSMANSTAPEDCLRIPWETQKWATEIPKNEIEYPKY
jgi:Domain of unknown function (DUF927)